MSEPPGGRFEGFVAGGAATTLPSQLFVELLPAIEDEAELRVTLYALFAIQRRRGILRAVRGSELASDAPLRDTLAHLGGSEALSRGLEAAVSRGTLLACDLDDGDALYFVNSEGGRRALLRARSGAMPLEGARPRARAGAVEPPARLAGAAAVYEQEIGALTPAIAEAIAEASERYPEGWITEALRLASTRNARSWAYAAAVLRAWEAEGRNDGLAEGAAGGTAGTDGPDAATSRDPFAHLIRRTWP